MQPVQQWRYRFSMSSNRTGNKSRCPVCGNDLCNVLYAPFCSRHCKNVDLLRWFNEEYSCDVKKSENRAGQKLESLYYVRRSPDSSVGRAED